MSPSGSTKAILAALAANAAINDRATGLAGSAMLVPVGLAG